MKILLTGAAGQLGWELQRTIPEHIEMAAYTRKDLDITDLSSLREIVEKEQPAWIINASAYTAVDKAETESEKAHQVNGDGVGHLATISKEINARFLHVSTDFVFDGTKGSPYLPEDQVNPLGVYGASKLEGEQKVLEILGEDALIIRTAWVYSSHGNNFVKTMLRLMNERDVLGVVDDQIGTPTLAAELAKVIYLAIEKDLCGIYHWTDAGAASWYDFAQAIYEEGQAAGLIDNQVQVNPIPTEAYPLPAKRPAYSVLDKSSLREATGYNGIHWRTALTNMLKELRDQ